MAQRSSDECSPLLQIKTINNPFKSRALIQVCGVARPGEILAIMGGSGAGKTTLMNILACQMSAAVQSEGSVRINGQEVSAREMRTRSAYVKQIDIFCGSLTVKEQLTFSARLRMRRDASAEERRARVDAVIREMNLTGCKDTKIGVPGRVKGISIGEKKRLAFASEVLTDPPILFCDEPTSGLDSFMAMQVVAALRTIASDGKTVITVIHQPSNSVFNMFDTVCFMSCGKAAYFGPVKGVVPFFATLGRSLEVPESYSPADHVIKMLSVAPATKEKDLKRVKDIRTAFESSEHNEELMSNFSASAESIDDSSMNTALDKVEHRYSSSFLTQLIALIHRSLLVICRDPILLRVQIILVVCNAVVIGTISWQNEIKRDNGIFSLAENIRNIDGVLFMTTLDMNFYFLYLCANSLISELPLFFREHKSRIYSVEAYYLAKTLAELPYFIAGAFLYAIIVYWATGLFPAFSNFVIYVGLCVLQVLVATSIAYAGACLFAEMSLFTTVMPMFIVPMLSFAGFYLPLGDTPVFLRFYVFISWFHYTYENLMINQWQAVTQIEGCTFVNATSYPAAGLCPALDGGGILALRDMHPDNFTTNILTLVAMIIFYRSIGLAFLFLRARYQKSDY